MVCVGTQECQHDGRHSEKEFWDQPRRNTEASGTSVWRKEVRVSCAAAPAPDGRVGIGARAAREKALNDTVISLCQQ